MIDWNEQWKTHGYRYRDGFVHIDLEQFQGSGEIKLEPGPGFGDLSHPTTWLVLKMMAPHIKGKSVLDIGSGSGVLALVAAALGAKKGYGIEIDPEAVQHAQKNAQLNHLESKIQFALPSPQSHLRGELVILMNMIRTEQEIAWSSIQPLTGVHGMVFSSGILKEEQEIYLAQCKKWGWKVEQVIEEGGWLGIASRYSL